MSVEVKRFAGIPTVYFSIYFYNVNQKHMYQELIYILQPGLILI